MPSTAPFTTPAGAEDVWIPVAGRAQLHGWWLPASARGLSAGTILFCHGNAGSLPDHVAFVESLRRRGFDIMMFDYRGYGRSSRVSQLSRQTLLRDALAAHDHLRERTSGDKRPVVLVGHSMGAVIGAALIAERPEAFEAAVLVAPFSSFPRVASDFAGPLGWALIARGMAAEESVTRFGQTPILLVHGGHDLVVRPYHSERIERAGLEAGVELQLLSVQDADHVSVFDERFGTTDAIASFIEAASDRPAGIDPTTSEDQDRAGSPTPGG